MSDYFNRLANEWTDRATELAAWTMSRMVNRVDAWGRYTASRKESGNHAITAPFKEERGKVFLTEESLAKHFRTRKTSGILGVHSTSVDLTSRWLAIDIDLHEPEELSVTPQGNFVAAQGWFQELAARGFDPLLTDSNGRGGFHLFVFFAEPLETASVHEFGARLVSDFLKRGLDSAPEIFPGAPKWDHYGDWLRLPGRHHTHEHYTRVFNDEPWTDEPWLEGNDAIDRLLSVGLASIEVAERNGLRRARRTVCIDFDGTIHSYRSGWCGAEVIPDPPIHGSRDAIARLRKSYRVVIHSARCQTPEGIKAVEHWLRKHGIEVDEVSAVKPPAIAYIDDRAIPFRGDWDDALATLAGFRR